MKRSFLQSINILKTYFNITLGLFIFAFAWTAFIIPSKIVGGGLVGAGTLVYFVSGIHVGYVTFVCNAILVAVALKLLGAKFGINTLFGIIMSSALFVVLQELITEPLVSDQFMAAMIGGGLSGLGVGIAFVNGGNTGGLDIVALIITKYKNISPGKVFLYINSVIIASSWFIFHSVEKIVYGYVVMAVSSYVIDLYMNGMRQSYQIMIYSNVSTIIAGLISDEVKHGVTCLHGFGWYSKKDIDVVMVIARKIDRQKILKIVNDTDKDAFISVAKVQGVFGKHYEKIKI